MDKKETAANLEDFKLDDNYNDANLEDVRKHIEEDQPSKQAYVLVQAPTTRVDVTITDSSRKKFAKTLLK